MMAVNNFEQSRAAEGTLRQGANTPTNPDTSTAGRDAVVEKEPVVAREDMREGYDKFRSSEREGLAGNNAEGDKDAGRSHHGKRLRRVLTASTVTGDSVRNPGGEHLGKVEEIMLDLELGRIAYVVVSFGGFLHIGNKLFAVPWDAFRIDEGKHEFVLDVSKQTLENAPGFDKDNWPDLADPTFGIVIFKHYGRKPYWEAGITDAGDYEGDNLQTNRDIEYETTTAYRDKNETRR
jgi:sporulation protein YlmC with PRC-barrel domain